jgi:ferrochelatase
MSFHGISQSYADANNSYYQPCLVTVRLLAVSLDLAENEGAISFQSRISFAKLLSPYTRVTLAVLDGTGIFDVDVICLVFSADCLGTLEEIEI